MSKNDVTYHYQKIIFTKSKPLKTHIMEQVFKVFSYVIAIPIIVAIVFTLVAIAKRKMPLHKVLKQLVLGSNVRFFHYLVALQNLLFWAYIASTGYSWWVILLAITSTPITAFVYTWATRILYFIWWGITQVVLFVYELIQCYLGLFKKGWF